jgi:methylglutaconyl-CoA hydratase
MRTITLSHTGDVSTIQLSRPEKRNAISFEMIEELLAALREIQERAGARALILTGSGTAFCSGMDLETLQAISRQNAEENLADSRRMAQLFRSVYEFPLPTIAAVNGPAVAGGCGLASVCDFTLAAPTARFGYTEVKVGFMPALVSVFLLRLVGEKIARDLLLTGRLMDAGEAHRVGLVNEVVPAEKLMTRAGELAADLARNSPGGLRATKALLQRTQVYDLGAALDLAVSENAAIRQTADFREGIAAFLEKRAPRWKPKP